MLADQRGFFYVFCVLPFQLSFYIWQLAFTVHPLKVPIYVTNLGLNPFISDNRLNYSRLKEGVNMLSLLIGLVGGLIAVVQSLMDFFYGGTGKTSSLHVTTGTIGALIFSVIALAASAVVLKWPKIGGLMMLIGGIGGFVCVQMTFLAPGVVLLLGGIIGVFSSKRESAATDSAD